MAHAGLQLLIDSDPRELHRKRSDGRRVIDTLHEALSSQGLIRDQQRQWGSGSSPSVLNGSPPVQTAEAQYCDVFRAALEYGMGVWVQVSQNASEKLQFQQKFSDQAGAPTWTLPLQHFPDLPPTLSSL